MRLRTKWLLAGGSAGLAAAAAAAYGLIARPRHLVWGATAEEIERPLPFDSLIDQPNYFTTRAVTIDARPEEVWPFVIDTSLLPLGTEIRNMVERETVLFANPEFEEEATWVVTLEQLPEGRTRLISRNRARFGRRPSAVLRYLRIDPEQFLHERGWLTRIRERSEELARTMRVSVPVENPVSDQAAEASPDETPAVKMPQVEENAAV